MTPDSLTYNGIDLYQLARLKVVATDVFAAPLRVRKIVVPGRSGSYDYGADFHDERELRLACLIDGEISDAQFDDLKYALARKGRIALWDHPDRYYIGQCFDAAEVLDFERHCLREFELVFACEPYAYALVPTELATADALLPIHYDGTRRTPTRIVLRNTGTTDMHDIRIIVREQLI